MTPSLRCRSRSADVSVGAALQHSAFWLVCGFLKWSLSASDVAFFQDSLPPQQDSHTLGKVKYWLCAQVSWLQRAVGYGESESIQKSVWGEKRSREAGSLCVLMVLEECGVPRDLMIWGKTEADFKIVGLYEWNWMNWNYDHFIRFGLIVCVMVHVDVYTHAHTILFFEIESLTLVGPLQFG